MKDEDPKAPKSHFYVENKVCDDKLVGLQMVVTIVSQYLGFKDANKMKCKRCSLHYVVREIRTNVSRFGAYGNEVLVKCKIHTTS